MDAVNAFNQELFSLMDSKPPISRAKMISITKSAIKAMKLYKHVVQIVEKFIKKCKPEYKVAGLYVVDSIVRQSRHQFGPDKDVFGPRFTKNITGTFENLCLCPVEDRSKIVRVLNLWQKNGVFKIEVIQPLLDMAAGTSSAAAPYTGPDEPGSSPSPAKEPLTAVTANSTMTSAAQLQNSDAFAAVAQLFQGQQLQQMLQNFQQQPVKPETETPPPLHTIQTQPQNITTNLGAVASQPLPLTQPTQHKTAFDKKLLDRFDYDDEPETGEETKKGEISSQPSFMQQLPAFSQHMEHFKPPMINMSQDPLQQVPLPPNGQLQACGLPPGHNFPVMMPPNALPGQPLPSSAGPPGFPGVYPPLNIAQQQQDLSMDTDHLSVMDGRHGRRSHSGSRSPKRRRSRSNSHTRRSRHTRSRSRSRDRRYHSPRSSSQDCREKERERRQKGLPPLKTKTLSVCSTTLWVGQLDKRTQQQDVACLLEEFGQIESISMIPPRGCAYIVMIHRQDAYRALQKLSRGNYKVNQKAIKIAWALNKGIKAEFKQYWDVDLGVTYIPWSKIKEDQLEEVKEGGILDLDTLSPAWTSIRKTLDQHEELTHNGRSEPQQPEEMHALPLAAPAVPPAQAPLTQQPIPGVGSLQPPVFPGPIGMPPPSFPPGIPPPPFIRPGFNPMQMPPGFPPPGAMPVGHPPSSKVVEDLPLDPAGLGGRKNDEASEVPNIFNNQMGPLGNQVVPVGGLPAVPPVVPVGGPPGVLSGVPTVGPPGVLPGPSSGIPGPPGSLPGAPPGNIHPPSSGLLGARPGIIPLQRPPLTPPQHMPHFPPPHGPRPPHPSMPPLPPQMMPRGPHPQMMHHEPPPPKGGFGMPLPHNMRPPFPPHGHGPPPPPQGPPLPPPFIRPVGPRDLEVPEEMDSRPFRGDRTGFRDREPERERDWDQDRDRDRDRGFGGRRSFGDGGRGLGADRIDARETLGGWQEDGGDYRGGGWDRDRDRERDRDRDRERDRDRDRERDRDRDRERDRDRDRERDRRDWREKRSSLDRDRERGRVGDDGERESGRGETGERGRGDGVGRERGRGAEGKEGERPRRERRERTTRWDRDDRLAELENMDRFRTPNNTGQPRVPPVVTVEASKEPSIVSPKQTESELVAAAAQVPTPASGPIASDLLPSAQKEPTETTQEAAS